MTAALEGGEWSAARPGRTLPLWKTRYPFYRRLDGPQGRSGRAENLVLNGIRSRTVQPVVSRYTDWATWPTRWLYAVVILLKPYISVPKMHLHKTRVSYLLIPAYWSYASVQCHSKTVCQVLLISIYRNFNIHLHARLLHYRQHLCILFIGGMGGPAVVPNSPTKNQFPLLLGSTVHTELLHRYSPVVALCNIRLYV